MYPILGFLSAIELKGQNTSKFWAFLGGTNGVVIFLGTKKNYQSVTRIDTVNDKTFL